MSRAEGEPASAARADETDCIEDRQGEGRVVQLTGMHSCSFRRMPIVIVDVEEGQDPQAPWSLK